jgi:hypothetical protein
MTAPTKRFWIRYGGSNRKYAAAVALLKARFGDAWRDYGTASLGLHHSNHAGVIPDTAENREWVRATAGISIMRRRK